MKLPKLPRATALKSFPSKFYNVVAVVLIVSSLVVGAYAHQMPEASSQQSGTTQAKEQPAVIKPTQSGHSSAPQTATQNVTDSTSTNAVAASTPSNPGTSDAKDERDFSLNTTSITVAAGTVSQPIRATSKSGKLLNWAALIGDGMMTNPLTMENTSSYTFTLMPSPAITKPGTYTVNVRAYIPRTNKYISKPVTVTVVPGVMFKLIALAPNYAEDTAMQFFVPFQIQPVMGVSITDLKMSATIVSYSGIAPLTIQGIWENGGNYFLNKNVAIMDYGAASGRVVIRVTVSASGYTTSLDIPYDIQAN
jgi:hypothetical protein